jgi:hypothetical protein
MNARMSLAVIEDSRRRELSFREQQVSEKPIDTPWVSVPGLLTAQCASNEYANYLEVTVHADPSDHRTDDITGDLNGGGRCWRTGACT